MLCLFFPHRHKNRRANERKVQGRNNGQKKTNDLSLSSSVAFFIFTFLPYLSHSPFLPFPSAHTHIVRASPDRVLMTQDNSVSTQPNQSAAESQLRLRDPLLGAGQLRATRTHRDRSISVHSISRRINCYGLEGKQNISSVASSNVPIYSQAVLLSIGHSFMSPLHLLRKLFFKFLRIFFCIKRTVFSVCLSAHLKISLTTERVMNNFDIW
jgi:hypothetical protein